MISSRLLVSCLLLPATLLANGSPAGAATAPRLRALLKQAPLVLSASVGSVTPYDDGRVAVAVLSAPSVIKGRPADAPVNVVEMRDVPTPPLFTAGSHVLAFLTPSPRHSYLAQHLPAGQYWAPVPLKPPVLAFATAADLAAAVQLANRVADTSRRPDLDKARRAMSARVLVFDLLIAPHPILVDDGIASLADVSDLASTLSNTEQQRLETALDRNTLPLRIRLALIETIASLGLKRLVPALQRVEDANLLAASWKALAQLGSPPAREQVAERLASSEPSIRIAALQQLARAERASAIPRLQQIAVGDADEKVRTAAIEALGGIGAKAVPTLESVFSQPAAPTESRQAVARALLQLGPQTAAEAYSRLAFSAPPDAQKYAVLLLLASGVPRADPSVQRVITTHPDDEIRRLAEHGLEVHHH